MECLLNGQCHIARGLQRAMERCLMLHVGIATMLISFGPSSTPATTMKCAFHKDQPEFEASMKTEPEN
uniref:Uncharacterized protein n=1 Tax=Ascaris lumbricoides TaxID=6252 RepID=A0A0M3IBG1_ASCLU